MKKLVIGALVALVLAAASGTVAPMASATDPVVVSIALCDINGGTTTVPAGAPIILRNPGWATGSYGLTKDYLLKQTTTDIIVRNGITTVVDLTNLYSDPLQLDRNLWLTRPSNTELGTLASGESVLVTNRVTFSQPVLVAYPPVGPSGDRGPYLIRDIGGSWSAAAVDRDREVDHGVVALPQLCLEPRAPTRTTRATRRLGLRLTHWRVRLPRPSGHWPCNRPGPGRVAAPWAFGSPPGAELASASPFIQRATRGRPG